LGREEPSTLKRNVVVQPEPAAEREPAAVSASRFSEDLLLGAAARARFRILRHLGEGGMGVVYEARDEERDVGVALKTLRHLTADSLAQFKREFRAMQDLHHPNLVRLGELVADGDRWFFTMELVQGGDFVSYVRPRVRRFSNEAATATLQDAPEPGEDAEPPPSVRTIADPGPSATVEFDEDRLRGALHQLASALAVVHGGGMVHRDIKPSNIRVEPNGRLVLMDFGLVVQSDAAKVSSVSHIAGTPVYMAPEQGTLRTVGSEADMYAVGVCLFEALTGVAPFDGSPFDVIVAKQKRDAPRASTFTKVPQDLDELCAALLERDPTRRPTASLVRDMLGNLSKVTRAEPPTQRSGFVGRKRETAALVRALSDLAHGVPITQFVIGESGVGKSALVRHFVESVAEAPDVCVLTGRCYEREALPFKAFDGVMDSLARFLMRRPEQARRFVPMRPGPLVHVFPVLRRVPAFAEMTTGGATMDPLEVRSRAFASLRETLSRAGEAYKLVITIDDMQWADADSVALLGEILQPPDAPRLLLVTTMRTSDPVDDGTGLDLHTGERVRELPRSIPGDVRTLRLGRLNHAEAQELAREVLGEQDGRGVNPAWVAEEAEGHPLFIAALARYSAVQADGERRPVRLDEAMAATLDRLTPDELRLVELLSLTTGPIAQQALEIASGLDAEAFAQALGALRVERFVTTDGARGADVAELYHDRIRVVAKRRIPRNARPELHRKLAEAYEIVGSANATALALHWVRAGDSARGRRYASIAADFAAAALAFERAATLYDWALQLEGYSPEERGELYARLGDALAASGRGLRAAEAYRRAARTSTPQQAFDLKRSAGEQLMRAGHIDDGLAAMRESLEAIGMRLPTTRLATLLSFLFWVLVVRLRGTSFRARTADEIPPADLVRIDACWSAALGLSISDSIRGASFAYRSLILALRAGEVYRVTRALALCTGYAATIASRRGWPYVESLGARSHDLARECGFSQAQAWADSGWGTACYVSGRFREAVEHLRKAEAVWRESPGASREADAVKLFLVNSLAQLGDLRELRTIVPRYLREAVDRGDLYGSVNLRIGYANLRWLAAGAPDEARRDVDEAMASWTNRGVHIEHFYELLARANIALYRGAPAEAWALSTAGAEAFEKALLLRLQSVRITTLHIRARAALALAVADASRGPELIASAERDARAIRAERMPWAAPLACLLLGACARLRGDAANALALIAEARTGFDQEGMRAFEAASLRAIAGLHRQRADGPEATAASQWASANAVAEPDLFFSMLAPGLLGRATPALHRDVPREEASP
jgi:serine/threonine protein kinase/tetratricopeptide (TPR) repeat protein